jgi:hypothetical protein
MEQDRIRSALVAALLPVLILALAGCRAANSKLSAQQTAQKLRQYVSPSYRAHCHPAGGSFWDYACTVTPPPGAKNKPYKLKVRVGPQEIIDRAYCGARTGTSLNC